MDEDPAAATPWPVLHDRDEPTVRLATVVDRPPMDVPDRPSIDVSDRSPNPATCPFLRGVEGGDRLGPPIEMPDAANRCVALREPVPQSLRQQELVCLTGGHVNCPRYLRGSAGPTRASVRTEHVRSTPTLTRATAGALAILVIAFAVSIGFVVTNGGIVLTAAVAAPTRAGAVLGEIETAPPTAAPTAVPTPVATPIPAAIATPATAPSPTPSVIPAPTARPTPRTTAKPASGRYALLKPCPGTPDCYVYVVRSGDNLFSIARYFGVSQKTIEAMNPWVKGGLVVGRGLRIPPPTR